MNKLSRALMMFAVATTAAGCGNTASQLSPTGPSTVTTSLAGAALDGFATSLTTGSAAIAAKGGVGKGKNAPPKSGDAPDTSGSDSGTGSVPSSDTGRRDNKRVEVVGRVTAVDPAARTLTVRGVVVSVPVTAVIRHGSRMFELDVIAVGDMVQVKGTHELEGLVATEVKVEQRKRSGEGEDEDEDGQETEPFDLEGLVQTPTGTCPVLTFNVGTTTVVTSATTQFVGGLCEALITGASVGVRGQVQPDLSMLATVVEIQP